MCGRYNLRLSPAELEAVFALAREPVWEPSENICPTQTVLAIRPTDAGREATPMRWGLVPFWSKEPKTKSPLFNARAETAATKPSFRAAYKRRRCLIPASGFYEWKKIGATKTGKKQPYEIGLADGSPFAFAGLWERWGDDDERLESCTILTCEPNDLLASIHDRMPVILHERDWDVWADPEVDADVAGELLVPFPSDEMTMAETEVPPAGRG